MTIENKSEFLASQQDVCEIGPKPEVEPDKICPTCIPDESFIPPDWWTLDKPFLNKKTCEYSIAVIINENSDTFRVDTIAAAVDSNGFEALKRTYVKPGLRMMLAYYGKMISDDIICALPPQEPGDQCGPTFDINFRDYIDYTNRPVDLGTTKFVAHSVPMTTFNEPPVVQGVAVNLEALEVYARTPEFRFTTINDSGILQVLVTVPAFVFDRVPETPDIPEVDTSVEKLVMNVKEFDIALKETTSALEVYSKYQAHFFQMENGSLFFADSNKQFYLSFIVSRMRSFRSALQTLLDSNNFRYGDAPSGGVKAHKIEITFDKTDPEEPFKIKRIRVKRKNCRFIKMKKGFEKPFLEKGSVRDQTTMGYISVLDKIHPLLTARKTPPWLDFVVEYTFPQLGVDFGSSNKFKDQRPDTCLADVNQINSAVLKGGLSFSKAFAYQFNKSNCLSMYGNEYPFDKTPSDFDPNKIKIYQNLPDFGFDTDKFKRETFDGRIDYMKSYVYDKYRKEKRNIKETSPLFKALSDFKLSFEGDEGTGEHLKTLIRMFNPCSFKDFALTILKCLFRGVDLDTAYLAVIKSAMKNIAAEGLEVVLAGLPADKQDKVREIVEEEFKDMPAPWEPGWKAGSLQGPRVNRATEAKDQRLNAEGGTLALKNRVQQVFSELKKSSFSGQLEVSFKPDGADALESLNVGYLITYNPNSESGFTSIDPSTDSSPFGDTNDKIDVFKFNITQTSEQINEYVTNILNYIPAENSEAMKEIINSLVFEKEKQLLEVSKSLAEIKQNIKELREVLADNEREQELLQDNPGAVQQIKDQIFNLGFRQEEKEDELKAINNEITEIRAGETPEIKGIMQQLSKAAISSLAKIEQMRGESITLQKDLQETAQFDDWNNLSDEEKEALITEEANKNRFASLRPGDDYEQGTLGKALGNTQQAITKAYVDAIIETAEIQEIMSALDNLPGIKILTSFVSKFSCPKTHFMFPPIGNFLSTLTFDPCGDGDTDLAAPEILQFPRFSWSFILDNLVKSFIRALKMTIKQALAALFAKLAQLIDASLCKLLGGQLPTTVSLMELLGREGCSESEILQAAGAAPEGRPPLPQEEYGILAETISNAGTDVQAKRALTGNPDSQYMRSVVEAVRTNSPAFSDVLSDPESVANFFEMAAGLLTPDQLEELDRQVDSNPIIDSPANKCLTNVERQNLANINNDALSSLPKEVLDEYNQQEQDRAEDNMDQVLDMVLNGPNSVLEDILDQALATSADPDCVDNINSVGAVLKKARETESYKNVKAGVFSRIQKAFMDDMVDWNLWEPFDAPGILSQILADKKGGSLNYYNWYRNLKSSLGSLAFIFPDVADLPQTIGIEVRNQFLNIEDKWNKDVTPKLNLRYTGDYEDGVFKSNIKLYDGGKNSFAHKVRIVTPEFTDFDIEVLEPVEDVHIQMLNDLAPFVKETGRYRAKMMRAFLERTWSLFGDTSISLDNAESVIGGINAIMFDKLLKSMMSDSQGQIPQGFLYGHNPVEITADDLTYVNPEPGSTEYTFEESAKVLGRSLTNNPRVQFLDPSQHGGSYTSPFYNILAEEKQGWSQFAKVIVSKVQGCEDVQSNFMFFQDILDKMERDESNIKPDDRLQLSPDCVIEKPFDKIASPSTHSMIGGTITAIIRMHVVDYMLRTFSLNANVDMDFKRNHSKIISRLIVQNLKDSLSNQTSFFATTYEGGAYWLLFLEQAVQLLKRKIDMAEIETDPQLEQIMEALNQAQKEYTQPTFADVFQSGGVSTEAADLVALGIVIASLGLLAPAALTIVGLGSTISSAISLNQMRFAAKLGTIYSVQEECMEALGYLVEEQLQFYSDMLAESIQPRPYIYDISKFFIGSSKSMLKGNIRAGEVEIEAPTGGQSNFDYGSIPDCVHNVNIQHPLSNIQFDAEELANNGGLYLEKYLRIEEKNITPIVTSLQRIQLDRQFIQNRNNNLKGVVNISKFKEFLLANSDKINVDANVSDFFGNAKTNLLEDEYEGSIGIKFGVRLCMVPPSDFVPISAEDRATKRIANREKSYIFGVSPTTASKYAFPICSFERDIPDNKLASYINSDENFNQDLKCYVDLLCETPEFKLLFDHIVSIKRVPSTAALYSYLNFYSSLGRGSDEREDADDNKPIRLDQIFNDTKDELRRLFVSNYKRSDFDPPDEEDSQSGFAENLTRDILSKTVNNVFVGSDVPWWLKFKFRRQKVDEDGEPCGNQFSSLLT